MFDQVKVNQNSMVNLLKLPERDNSDMLFKKSGGDFFSMVMEKTVIDDRQSLIDDRKLQASETQRNNEKAETSKSGQYETSAADRDAADKISREMNSRDTEKNSFKESDKKEINEETGRDTNNKNIKQSDDSMAEDVKTKKSDKEIEDEGAVINQLNSESNIRNLMAAIKSLLNGDKKSEEESFQKLFGNLKFKHDKEHANSTLLHKKNDAGKNHKNIPDLFASITKKLKDSISRELFKNIENKKNGNKPLILNDKELKELASTIIEGLKKNKAKDNAKHEARNISADEIRNDKKQVLSAEQPSLKKAENSDDSSFDKNGQKDKNSGRDTFSYNNGKVEFSNKSGLEKMEHTIKASDFRENLQEIIDKAKVTVRDSRNGTFTVRLNPQELGNVNVNLVMENGVITGKFLVDNEEVKSLLLSSLNELKYQMEEAGVAVGDFSVDVSDQREKYLRENDNEGLSSLSFNSDKEVIAAVDQYNMAAAAHTGHINMVI